MNKSAVISQCQSYRYELRRIWDECKPLVLFVGLNPSIADAEVEDNTSRVCINYAKRWGYGGLLLGNLFAFRSTDQAGLFKAADPVGPDNDAALEKLQDQAALVVCAWSASGGYMQRNQAVLGRLRDPHCEPPRLSRRLHSLRGWSHEQNRQILP
jgi:hypothetical protein